MKVQTKLTRYFLAVTLVVAASALVGCWMMYRLSGALYEIAVVRLPSIEGLDTIREGKAILEDSMHDILYHSAGHKNLDEENRRQESGWGLVEKGWKIYEPLPQTPEEAVAWKEFARLWQEYKTGYQALGLLLETNQNNGGNDRLIQAQEMERKLHPVSDRLDATVDQLVRINHEVVARTKIKTINNLTDMGYLRRFTLASVGATVLLALGATLYFGRKLGGPISKIHEALAAVARRDFSVRVPVTTGDEIGRIGAAVNSMAESLEMAEERLKGLCDNLTQSMIYQFERNKDGSPRFLYVSNAVERIHGVSPEEVLKNPAALTGQVLEEDAHLLMAAETTMEDHRELNVTVRMRRSDDEIRWIHLAATPHCLSDGRIVWDGVETDITGIKQTENDLRLVNRSLKAITAMHRVMGQTNNEGELLREVCKTITEYCGYELVWTGVPEHDAGKNIKVTAFSGVGSPYVESLKVSWADNEWGRGPSGTAIRTAEKCICHNMMTTQELEPWRPSLIKNGLSSSIALPLKRGGEVFGIITCYSKRIDAFDEAEAGMLTELANDLAFGIQAQRDGIARRKAAETLRRVYEGLPDGLIVYDIKTEKLVFVNETFCKMIGYDQEQLCKMGIQDLHPRESMERVNVEFAFHAAQIKKYSTNIPVQRCDGSVVPVNISSSFVEVEGRPCLIGIFHDITQEKQVQNALEASERRLDQVMHLLGEWVWETGADGIFVYSNPVVEKILGYAPGEIVGIKSFEDLFNSDQKQDQKVWLDTVMAEHGRVDSLEFLLRAKSGKPVTVRFSAQPTETGYRGAVLDVTQQKETERQFLRSQRMESIGLLAGGVAHDLNNVLSPIMLSMNLLRHFTSEPQAREILDSVDLSARRGADIIRQLLLFARGVEGEYMEIRPNHLLKDLQLMLKNTLPKNIEIRTAVAAGCRPVMGDVTQLHQVLTNLCVNARDAMPDGGVLSITAENSRGVAGRPAAEPGEYVILLVKDTGTGIPEEIREKIFDPFFTTKDLGKGTGLGLSTVHTIVKNHGGWVEVESSPGAGTCFKIMLPAAKKAAPAEAPKVDVQAFKGQGETVLVVDDDSMARELMVRVLGANGYHVLMAGNGAEAIEVYAQNRTKVAVVILDMMMPVLDGPATIGALRKIDSEVRIIGMSGTGSEGFQDKLEAGKVKHFMAKPFTSVELMQKIREVLEAKV